jgi:hypothetical protein
MDNTSSTIISYIVICNNSKGSVLKLQEKIKQRSVSATRKSNSKMNEKVSDGYSNYPRYHMKLSFSFLKQMLNKKRLKNNNYWYSWANEYVHHKK